MRGHGLGADVEFLRDINRPDAGGKLEKDLVLAVRQGLVSRRTGIPAGRIELRGEQLADSRTDVFSSGDGLAHGCPDLFLLRILGEIASGAGANQPHSIL